MHSKYSGRAVSLVVVLPLLFLPMALTGQRLEEHVVPLKNWAAPLYWQPSQAEMAERETAVGLTPKLVFSASQVSPSALTFVAVTPCRLVDTRGVPAGFNGLSPFSGPSIAPSTSVAFPVQSAAEATADTTPTPCGTIPLIAQAYSFNITVIPKTAGGIGFVTLWPTGGTQPGVSTLNDGEGVILANSAIVPAGTPSGGVSFFNSGPATTDVIIDMNGFYAAPSDLEVAGNIDFSGVLEYQGNPVLQLSGSSVGLGPGSLFSNATGSFNTASGSSALFSNTTGSSNTASGANALYFNTSGFGNTATGVAALGNNATGSYNTASGMDSLTSNTTGNYNTASGYAALENYSTPIGNTAVGYEALQGGASVSANTGTDNTAVGFEALEGNSTGSLNTATGASALSSNTTGGSNTASGAGTLQSNTAGMFNTAIGFNALNGNTTGSVNIAIGDSAALEVAGGNSNNIHIGSLGVASDGAGVNSGVIRIGTIGAQTSFFVAGVNNANLGGDSNAVGVLIDTTTGQLGVASSSRRYKEEIEDMGDASRDLMRLRPVTFRYKKPLADGSKPIQYGLIAEEVDEVYPDLVAHSAGGQIETVKYQVLDSMLLNEVQRQQAEIGAQKEQLQKLTQQVDEQRQQNQSLQERLARLEAALTSTPSASGVAAIR